MHAVYLWAKFGWIFKRFGRVTWICLRGLQAELKLSLTFLLLETFVCFLARETTFVVYEVSGPTAHIDVWTPVLVELFWMSVHRERADGPHRPRHVLC